MMLTLLAALAVASDPGPAAAPKPVAVTRDAEKALLEGHKKATPRLPMPPAGDAARGVNNGRFRAYYLPGQTPGGGLGGRDKDPAETLDTTFKVKLFWVVSRANNCLYCLGHQEHKLTAAGVTDDGIAALDGDWDALPEPERAAVAFAKKLTFQPHSVTAADVAGLGKHFTPAQCLEIVVAVAGFNAMNRWTDGLNIPADENGDFFKKGAAGVDLSTFVTPTSAKYKSAKSRVAPVSADAPTTCPPAWPARPALETRAQVEEQWKRARTRTPVLPVAAAVPAGWANVPDAPWARLFATFPVAGKSRAQGVVTAQTAGTLPPRLRAEVAWTAARADRAWYALAVARDRLKAQGFTDDQVFALDAGADLPDVDKKVVAFARKLAVAPATVTDADVAGLRGPLTDHQVAEVVHQVCTAALFDRVTEAAGLAVE